MNHNQIRKKHHCWNKDYYSSSTCFVISSTVIKTVCWHLRKWKKKSDPQKDAVDKCVAGCCVLGVSPDFPGNNFSRHLFGVPVGYGLQSTNETWIANCWVLTNITLRPRNRTRLSWICPSRFFEWCWQNVDFRTFLTCPILHDMRHSTAIYGNFLSSPKGNIILWNNLNWLFWPRQKNHVDFDFAFTACAPSTCASASEEPITSMASMRASETERYSSAPHPVSWT
jgi:hypothetical protein